MTHRERFVRTPTGQAVDRVPFIKVFVEHTVATYPDGHTEVITKVYSLVNGAGSIPSDYFFP